MKKNGRKSGILLPVSSLPSDYGIGAFSKEAYQFVDRLKEAGQSYWQILPLGPTGYGDSPYQSFSTFAGNPYFIDLEELVREGYLTKEECRKYDFGGDSRYIDYEKLYLSRFKILEKAFLAYRKKEEKDKEKVKENGKDRENQKESGDTGRAFEAFKEKNAYWLKDYALFMAVKEHFGGKCFTEWDEDIRMHGKEAVEKYRSLLKKRVEFYRFIQFLFHTQWQALKKYANKNGIRIIGDLPIYVAFDSSDVWAGPELFQLDKNHIPTAAAGCPPDAFSADGQLWGNPLYRWDYHRETGYEWWMKRIDYCFELFDMVRIDHFRGFDAYYSIPYGAPDARKGVWEKGPGYDFFETMNKTLGKKPVIAEDLGFLTPSVRRLLKQSGYPGMKVLQFAFDSREESDYLPHNYRKNCVVYTGTHDNDTVLGWYEKLRKRDKRFCRNYLDIGKKLKKKKIPWKFVRAAMGSVANLSIIPMQDYLGLGSEARINTPSTLGDNWKWRMGKKDFTKELAKRIRRATKTYKRL